MSKLKMVRGFAPLLLIVGGAIVVAGLVGGLAYEYKNNQSILSFVNKDNLLAQVSSVPPPLAPSITALSPTSGPIGTAISITGSGFTPTGNKIFINGITGSPIDNLSSMDGTLIKLKLPSQVWPQMPPCPPGMACIQVMPNPVTLTPGIYTISMINANGKSNSATFKVISTTVLPCPLYAPPSPDYCRGGTIVYGGYDSNGCSLGAKCVDNTDVSPAVPALNNASPIAQSVSTVFNKDLVRGQRNDDVKRLQQLLATDKSIYPEGVITGFFNLATEKAVKAFQKKNGLRQVGRVGPVTRAKLQEVFGSKVSTTQSAVMESPSSPATLVQMQALIEELQKQIQELLKQRGQ